MNFAGHLRVGVVVGGISTGTMAITTLEGAIERHWQAIIVFFLSVVIGSQYPDIDTGSKPSRYFAMGCLALLGYGYYYNMADLVFWVAMFYLIPKTTKHRGLTHTYWVPLSLAVCAYLFPFPLFDMLLLGASLGVISHLVADQIYPWTRNSFNIVKGKNA
jgi:hypothetical protein